MAHDTAIGVFADGRCPGPRGLGQRPAGLLHLSVPRAVIPNLLELIASFCKAYPEVEVKLAASKEATDLAAEGFHAAVRQGHLVAPDMVAVPMTPPFRLIVVGSPAYFAERSRPRHPNDLRQHACLRWRRSNGAFRALVIGAQRSPPVGLS
jgi:DNA-binding transcriptional LysR family regulator